MHPFTSINLGMGRDSTALAIGCVKMGLPVDAFVYSDTGSENRTPLGWSRLDYTRILSAWLVDHGYPPITVLRWQRKQDSKRGNAGEFTPLHESYMQFAELPSVAFGMGGCSGKWKQGPADRYHRQWAQKLSMYAQGFIAATGFDMGEPEDVGYTDAQLLQGKRWMQTGGQFRRALGYHAGEVRSKADPPDEPWRWFYPLQEWGWGKLECLDAILCAGLPDPGKSACFVCPNTRPREWIDMETSQPEEVKIAVEMERKWEENTKRSEEIHGLVLGRLGGVSGRHSLRTFLASDYARRMREDPELGKGDEQQQMFAQLLATPCACYEDDTPRDGVDEVLAKINRRNSTLPDLDKLPELQIVYI